ncbi:hypothetical protein JL722_6808 [Aureococcus anophagefferens]|nr:hypothetical protein JL722_6808 [Aureococcus anophagefferens]
MRAAAVAVAVVAAACAKRRDGPETPCPLTYVYDLPEFWDEPFPFAAVADQSEDAIFGPKCATAGMRDTQQYAMPTIALWRLLRGGRCRSTANASAAALFLVPLWPRPKNQQEWAAACAADANLDLAARLPHLTPANAHRHVILIGKGQINPAGNCDACYAPNPLDDEAPYPHLVSAPYPSSVHARVGGDRPWAVSGERATLVSCAAGLNHGRYASQRRKLRDDCARAGDDCAFADMDAFAEAKARARKRAAALAGAFGLDAAHHFTDTMRLVEGTQRDVCDYLAEEKQSAVFCLEPGGDSPYRKSIYDSVLSGCIPVVFSQYARAVAPHHWGSFRNASTVFVDEAAYAAGDLDLFEFLRGIPGDAVAAMQRTIDAHAHRLMYALDDYPHDAVENILVGAAHLARRREKRRAPGR